MWNPILADPIARFERDLSRLGARLGAIEHAVGQLEPLDRAVFRPEVSRLDDELWRLDLRVVTHEDDLSVLEAALCTVGAEIADLEQAVERRRRPPAGATVLPLRTRGGRRPVAPDPDRSVA